jgi:hypothetical protein
MAWPIASVVRARPEHVDAAAAWGLFAGAACDEAPGTIVVIAAHTAPTKTLFIRMFPDPRS